MKRLCDERRKCLRQRRRNLFDECLRELFYGTRRDTGLLHAFCGDVIRLHSHGGELQLGSVLYVWVGKLVSSVIQGRPSKDNIVSIYAVVLIDILRALEPNKVYNAVSVGEMGNDAFASSACIIFFKAEDSSFDLYERHVRTQLVYGIDAASVYVFIRVVFEQVTVRLDMKFLT